MSCPCEKIKREMPKCEGGTPPVLEINSVEAPVLFHTITIPASIGDETTIPPTPGAYRNARVFYEADNVSYLYDSDGIPQVLSDGVARVTSVNGQTGNVVLSAADLGAQEKLTAGTSITISNRNVISAPPVDTVLNKTSPNPISNSAVATAIDTITTELDRTVVYDLEMDADAESVSFTEDKVDVVTGVTSKEVDTIPTASATSAGTISAADFRSITYSQERLDALENGSVAIANLSASPSQTDLTNAWLNATGYDELINRASIFDITNSKVWTYYTNILLWEETPAGAVTVNPFTNSTAGTILGSNVDGNISANVDGTGSVAGWSTLVGLVNTKGEGDMKKSTYDTNNNGIVDNSEKVNNHTVNDNVPANVFSGQATGTASGTELTISNPIIVDNVELKGDTEQQTYSGKNKFSFIGMTSGQVTGINNGDGTITISGTANKSGGLAIGRTNATIPAGTYTLSISRPLSYVLNLSFANEVACRIAAGNTYATATIPESYDKADLFMAMTSGTTYNDTFGIQLVQGSTADYNFEPYVGGTASPNPDYPQEVQTVTGRQTITISDGQGNEQEYKVNFGGEEFYKENISSGYLTSSGEYVSDSGWGLTDYMPVEAGRDYVYSGITLPGNAPYSGYYDSNKTFISSFKQSTGTNTITIPSGVAYVRVSLRNTSPNIDVDTFSFKLDGVDIELCKIGDYQDYIYKSGEDWYVHKDINKVLLDGTQYVTQYGTATANKSRFTCSVYGAADVSPDVIVNMSDKFVGVTRGDTWNNKNGVYQLSGGIGFYWEAIAGYTREQVQTWLSTNNVIAYYLLATPTDTKITDNTLIGQLNDLMKAGLYDTTEITVDGSLPAILNVTYFNKNLNGVCGAIKKLAANS